MIDLTPAIQAESEALRREIWELLQEREAHPGAVADALLTILAHLLVRNASAPLITAEALAGNLIGSVAARSSDWVSNPSYN
jgi:hypothetical protein